MSDNRRQSGLWSRNPETGYYQQAPIPNAQIQPKGPYAYYEPPPRQSYQPQPRRSSFSERTRKSANDDTLIPSANGVSRTQSKKERSLAAAQEMGKKVAEPVKELLNSHPETTSDQLAATKHVNSTALPGSAQQPPLTIDPDYIPSNLRAAAWSPDVLSPKQQKSRQTSNKSSSIPDTVRKGSVPGQSPLQSLESWSKEEKRAKLEQAEHRAKQRSTTTKGQDDPRRSATLRSERGRVVSDGMVKRPSQPERQSERRQFSGPASPDAIAAAERFQNASNALRENSQPNKPSPRQPESRSVPSDPGTHEQRSRRVENVQGDDLLTPKLAEGSSRQSNDLGRAQSGKYKHRARDAGFAGAAAAYSAGPPISLYDESAERGKAAYERRKTSIPIEQSPVSPISQESDRVGLGVGRSKSKRLQRSSSFSGEYTAGDQLQSGRAGPTGGKRDVEGANAYQEPGPISPGQAQNTVDTGTRYAAPPPTAAVQQVSQHVGFHPDADQTEKHHRFGDMFHQHERRKYTPSTKPLEDWRHAKTARLTTEDLDFEKSAAASAEEDAAWWEKGKRSSTSGKKAIPDLPQHDEAYEEQAQKFEPFLFLKCGPLLRYTGIRKESDRSNASTTKEVWRGSIMIVTDDDQSDLSRTPVLRLFAQPMDLSQPPPPPDLIDPGKEFPAEHEDSVAGQVKLSRTGRPVYVRPVHDIDGEIDLSREENNEGLFSATRPSVLGPLRVTVADGYQRQHIGFEGKSRVKKRDGEQCGRHRDVKAARLHTEHGFTFWRFNIEIELGDHQLRVAYRVNKGPAIGFWVPAKGETMNILFHSCNGFSMSVDPNKFSGPDPLWRDALNRHQSRPFHVMIGGGDQIYNDAAMRDTVLFKAWLSSKNPEYKRSADFSPELQDELEKFYLHRYAMWFSQGLFGMANSQIPMINIWDDHDIIDGYGSYPHHFMSTRVFSGLGCVAFKYYLLFQHQSLSTETEKEEPSWLLGKSAGPYITELSRSVYVSLGNKVTFVGLDCRTERMRDEVLSADTYNNIFDRCQDEIIKGETRHLIVLLGVPIAYPRLNFLENVLTSRAMTPIKALGKSGVLGGFINKFDGGVEILDDLDDHWTAKHHKGERNWFIEELQELAAEKSVRVTILGGDVHLGAIGQFYSPRKLGLAKDRDHRYMPNIISSAIVNTPPPTTMADVLNRRNKVHHLNAETDEDMIPMFSHDVDGSKRNNNHLMPRRNFCIIREYVPGSTPPSTPVQERLEPGTPMSGTYGDAQDERVPRDRRFPPSSMKRTMSLTRGPVNLVRRLSGSSKSRKPPVSLAPEQAWPYNNEDRALPQRSASVSVGMQDSSFAAPGDANERPIHTFHRRPTNLSEKEVRKAATAADVNSDGREPGHINLESGLDISLCMEVDQRDPSGTTVPYRLLIPALWYEGTGDPNPVKFKSHRGSFMDRLRRNRKRETPRKGDYADDWSESEGSRTPSPLRTSQDRVTEQNTAANAMGLTSTGRGAYGRAGPYNGSGHNGTGPQDATPRAQKGSVYGREISAPISLSNQNIQGQNIAYSKGYNLSSPPISAYNDRQGPPTMQSQHQTQSTTTRLYPQSGYRRTGAPPLSQSYAPPEASTGASRAGNADHNGYNSENSIAYLETYSDEDDAQQRRIPPARRGSKAERFFGIGDTLQGAIAGGGRGSLQSERPPVQLQQQQNGGRYSMDAGRPNTGELGQGGSLRKGGNWKIWKKGWYDTQRGQ